MTSTYCILQSFDAFLKQSPWNYPVHGVGRELSRFGYTVENLELSCAELSDYPPQVLDTIPQNVLAAIADHIELLEAGRTLYHLIDLIFEQRTTPIPPVLDGLMTQAFGSATEQSAYHTTHLTHSLGDLVLWRGLNGLPFRVIGVFESVPVQLEISRTQANLREERWGELTQVPYHGARPDPAAQPSHAFILRLVHHIWNLAAAQGFVTPQSAYSPPPWLQDPVYHAVPKPSRYKWADTAYIEYRHQRCYNYRANGSFWYYPCTAAKFRALYPEHRVIHPEVKFSPPTPSHLEVCQALTQVDTCPDALSVIWAFNNAHRPAHTHHLWRLHSQEIAIAQDHLKLALESSY